MCLSLIDQKADVLFRDEELRCPLMEASHNQLISVCTTILNQGEDINAQDSEGRTALMCPLHPYSDSPFTPLVCMELLERGADINIKDSSGKTAFDHAAQYGRRSVCEAILGREDLEVSIMVW